MEELKKYNIEIFSLAEKEYVYDYASDSVFFEELSQDLIEKGQFEAKLVLDKSSTMIRLDFHIKAVVGQVCDRTSEEYDEEIETKNRVFLKFGDRDEELTDEIETIHRNTARINVAKYIYDFLVLALPVKRLHPRFRDEEIDEADDVLVYTVSSEDDQVGGVEESDPRWEALKNIKQKIQ